MFTYSLIYPTHWRSHNEEIISVILLTCHGHNVVTHLCIFPSVETGYRSYSNLNLSDSLLTRFSLNLNVFSDIEYEYAFSLLF